MDIPNLSDKSVPIGPNEAKNVKIREQGEPKILKGKDHLNITTMIDTESANLLAGSRFAVLKAKIAKLQRALIAFMLDKASERIYRILFTYGCQYIIFNFYRSITKIL